MTGAAREKLLKFLIYLIIYAIPDLATIIKWLDEGIINLFSRIQ